jgi:hypothetical protein
MNDDPTPLKARWLSWERLPYRAKQVPPGIVTEGVDVHTG